MRLLQKRFVRQDGVAADGVAADAFVRPRGPVYRAAVHPLAIVSKADNYAETQELSTLSVPIESAGNSTIAA
jgi:hypothetical protein